MPAMLPRCLNSPTMTRATSATIRSRQASCPALPGLERSVKNYTDGERTLLQPLRPYLGRIQLNAQSRHRIAVRKHLEHIFESSAFGRPARDV